ncbi:unnamed protein product [Timema podura]|uniref:Uncharacterized protein n=1 Tax=Timema podura TaxID=61482 RepID=A0ABN7P547_TIMPD|nr:unnamed protein product [Timema podura]
MKELNAKPKLQNSMIPNATQDYTGCSVTRCPYKFLEGYLEALLYQRERNGRDGGCCHWTRQPDLGTHF